MSQLIRDSIAWLRGHSVLVVVLFLVSTILTVGGAAFFIVRLPTSYFQLSYRERVLFPDRPILRALSRLAKNLLGIALVILGFLMALPGVPGQGILTLLIGVTLLNFPGKRRLECRLARRPAVLRSLNQIREYFGRPPFIVDGEQSCAQQELG